MNLQHQDVVDALVGEHAQDFAYLHHDLATAVPEVASRWVDRFGTATKLHGMTRCTCVRQTLFGIFGAYGEECFSTLTVKQGPALSVVLAAAGGTRIRVRRWPSDNLGHRVRVVSSPPPGQREAAAQVRQMALDEGMPEQVFPAVAPHASADLFVLWWANSDEVMLEGASLAVVANIDDSSQVRILATVPLPPALPRAFGSQANESEDIGGDPLGDFDEDDFDEGSSADGTTSA